MEVKYKITLVTQRKEDQKQEALHWEVITTALQFKGLVHCEGEDLLLIFCWFWMIYNISLVVECCNLCCHGNSIEFIVPFIQNDFPDFISWWIIWLLLGVQSNCKKVSRYRKHKHWHRYFHIRVIQMNATCSFLASNGPSLCNDSLWTHEMDFHVRDVSRPKGHLFLTVEIREVSGLARFSLNIQDLTLKMLSDVAMIQQCMGAQGDPMSSGFPPCSPELSLNHWFRCCAELWAEVQQLPPLRLKMTLKLLSLNL